MKRTLSATMMALLLAQLNSAKAHLDIVQLRSVSIAEFIAQEEGLRKTTYDDLAPNAELSLGYQVKGTLTIGYGHTGDAAFAGNTISETQALQLLEEDIKYFQRGVNALVETEMSLNQETALVSLAYNIGLANFESSTALERFNAGNVDGAAEAMKWWNKSKGQVLEGLVKRREREAELLSRG